MPRTHNLGAIARANKARNRRKAKTRALNKVQKKQVKAIVEGEAETKRATWYSQFDQGLVARTGPYVGTLAGSGWQVHNNTILSNFSDICRLIPEVDLGTDKYTRIGVKINPTSLIVKGSLRCLAKDIATTGLPQNLTAYVYVLQHVSLKSYGDLFARNQFSQLIDAGDGLTIPFMGNPLDAKLPIAKQFYRVLSRKQVTLRYGGGFTLQGPAGVQPVTMLKTPANSHTWYADFQFNLTKHLPNTLTYPETLTQGGSTADRVNPTNSSIFMCMGYVDWLNPGGSSGPVANYNAEETSNTEILSQLEATYVSVMTYKDM